MKNLLRNNLFVFCVITSGFTCIPGIAISQDDYEIAIDDIKGQIIPNIEDTSILRLIYGNYFKIKEEYYYNLGPQSWNNMDSTYMMVENIIGDSSTKIIYIRGATAVSSTMHNYYNEIVLLFNKDKSGWIIRDVIINDDIPDYCDVELKGVFGNKYLVAYITCGVYGGGIYYKGYEYTLIERDRFLNPKIFFITEYNNGGSEQCQCDSSNSDQNKYCYNYTGYVKYTYNDTLKSFMFDYSLVRKNSECDWKNEKEEKVYQQWYMNIDIAFQSKGDLISEWAKYVEGKIDLTNSEIIRKLNEK